MDGLGSIWAGQNGWVNKWASIDPSKSYLGDWNGG